MASKKIAHLEMIQGIVNRLSQNSFLLKGWTVVVVSGLLAVGAARTESFLGLPGLGSRYPKVWPPLKGTANERATYPSKDQGWT